MTDAPTLKEFFALPAPGAWPREQWEQSPELKTLRQKLAAAAPALAWTGVWEKVAAEIPRLFQVSTPGILVKAWNIFRLLVKYLNREHYPPNEVIYLELGEHTVRSDHHPYIEVRVNEMSVQRLTFHILLSLTFKEVTLKIQDGKLKAITPVACEGKGVVKLGDFVLWERKTGPVALPATLDLGEGIPIPV
jgi:hypothetical protein